MKKIIIISVAILAILGVICGLVWQKKSNTVADFSQFPCEFRKADVIAVSSVDGSYVLSRVDGRWAITSPVREWVDMMAASELDRFVSARVLVDEKRDITPEDKTRLMHERPTHVTFKAGEQQLCAIEFGRGYKLPTVDAERRWVFMENAPHAWRTFVPLMDYAQLFEQPLAGWRSRTFMEVPSREIRGLHFWTPGESFRMLADAPKNKDNPQGWRIEKAERDQQPIDSDFEIDARRVATVIELLAPFMVDDWVDALPKVELERFYFGGKLTIETLQQNYILQIGPEIDFKKHPEWARHGEGARFVKIEGDPRIGIMTSRRLLGLFPALDEMRTKKVWNVDSTRFAGIDIVVGDACLRYAPTAPDVWSGMPCLPAEGSSEAKADFKPLDNRALAMFVKGLTMLQAVRYAAPNEHEWVSKLPEAAAARILIYDDQIQAPSHVLYLSDSVNGMYRYAMATSQASEGAQSGGPVFLLTEAMSQFLLGDLTQPPSVGGF